MKRFIAVTLACCVVFGVVGCGNGTNETNTPTNTEQSEQKEEKKEKIDISKMSDEEIINKFVEAGFPISKMIVYTEETLGNFVCFLGSGSEAVTGSEVSEASVVVSASFCSV
ncbi:MAG: hypothetical protein HFE58_12615 [Firmicutes bacterium]|nr:hypothetical protein [Bacillota bacterium]